MKCASPTKESATKLSGWRPTLSEHHSTLTKAADACAQFIADIERGSTPYWLTLSGFTGTGKTMMARQTFERASELNPGNPKINPVWTTGHGVYNEDLRRPNAVWMHTSDFKRRYLDNHEYDLPEYLRADFIVAVDDLGAVGDTKNATVAEALYRLADQRMHRWMLWTANLTLEEISAQFDPRISSRLIRDENKFVVVTAPDFAIWKRQQK